MPGMRKLIGRAVDVEVFGTLDKASASEIAAAAPRQSAGQLSTRLRTGRFVIVSSAFIEAKLNALLRQLDDKGYDLLVVASTGISELLPTATPCINGHTAVESWIAALIGGRSRVGMIFPLKSQISERDGVVHGTLLESAQNTVYSGSAVELVDAAARLEEADLILMHSISYSEETAGLLSARIHKPVVTARRLIAGAVGARLAEMDALAARHPVDADFQKDPLKLLPTPQQPLTPREWQVVALVIKGHSNKSAARVLSISHRTIEIHRGRALAKFGVSSAAELIRRALVKDDQ